MDSRTLALLQEQAQAELEAALRREEEGQLNQKLLHSDSKAKRERVKLLQKQRCLAEKVRNIRIPMRSLCECVCMYGMEWNFCQKFSG